MNPDDTEHWRASLTGAIQTWRRELLSLEFEKRGKERMIVVAQTPHLKAGRFSKKIHDANGRPIDINANVINEMQVRIAQLEVQIQEHEVLIALAEEDLEKLPAPAEDGDAP